MSAMGTKLYVGNLSFSTSEETLRSVFGEEGREVREVIIVTDRGTGQPRGFGFVDMRSPEDAQAAIKALDGREVDGRSIRVSEAREQSRDGNRRGGFGGGGGGGGGFGGGGGGRGRRPGGRGGRDFDRDR
jgi:cold-inducible RNA-binding protein